MRHPWVFVEPCCGSAAVSLALLGAKKAVLPFQGSKWRFRHELIKLFRLAGVKDAPVALSLEDGGPWGTAAPMLFDPVSLEAIISHVRFLSTMDATFVFRSLQGRAVPESATIFAAEFLWLQRLAFSGKAVGVKEGRWVSPGLNHTSAYGVPATDKFGAIRPMAGCLVDVLEGYRATLRPVAVVPLAEAAPLSRRTVVYIDPPYRNTTGYPGCDMSRDELVHMARFWATQGASVFVSEAEPLVDLSATGWKSVKLSSGRDDTSRFRSQAEEWVTYRLAAR